MKKDRRDFLKLMSAYSSMGISATAFSSIFDMLFLGSINQAAAATSSNSKLLIIQAYAAPERWVFDKFLDPYNSNNHIGLKTEGNTDKVNHQVVNYLTEANGRLQNTEYKFATVNGLKCPYLWSQNVGNSSGATRPMGDLLNNYLSIRGVNNGNGVHPISAAQTVEAAIGGTTITGAVADASNAPISHFAVNPVYVPFRSEKGKGRLRLAASSTGGTDLIAKLTEPFNNTNPFIAKDQLNKTLLDKMSSFNSIVDSSMAAKKSIGDSSLQSLAGAKDLMFDKLDKMTGDYVTLRDKYRKIIQTTMNIEMIGINNKAVGLANVSDRDDTYRFNGKKVLENDLRNLVPYFRYNSGNTETLDNLADIFTAAEYALNNGMSNSVHIRVLPWLRLNVSHSAGVSVLNHSFDAHTFGAMTQIMLMNSFYACFAGCMIELIDQLKATGVFNDTVIQFSGEFERRPRQNGIGSDHAGEAQTISLWSGKIDGAQVIGNVQNSNSSTYYGSYGYAAPDEEGHVNNVGNVASTIADILGVPSTSPNNHSLISMSNGKVVVPEKRLAKNKEAS
ncbi:MAG: DUF1501 domain-containing protein [Bdellovibrionota bacterium]|nr:DUF1501 domain-containing protein [Bdellovibrionota bacterium]